MRTKFHNYKEFKEVAFNPENKYKLSPDFNVEDGTLYLHVDVYNKKDWYLFTIHISPYELVKSVDIFSIYVGEYYFNDFDPDIDDPNVKDTDFYGYFLCDDKNFQTFVNEKLGKYKNIFSKTQWVHSVPIYYDLNEKEEKYEHCECFYIDWDDEKEDAFLDSYEMF